MAEKVVVYGPGDYYGEQILLGLVSIAVCAGVGYAVGGQAGAAIGVMVGIVGLFR